MNWHFHVFDDFNWIRFLDFDWVRLGNMTVDDGKWKNLNRFEVKCFVQIFLNYFLKFELNF
jgi:hypothetical protein